MEKVFWSLMILNTIQVSFITTWNGAMENYSSSIAQETVKNMQVTSQKGKDVAVVKQLSSFKIPNNKNNKLSLMLNISTMFYMDQKSKAKNLNFINMVKVTSKQALKKDSKTATVKLLLWVSPKVEIKALFPNFRWMITSLQVNLYLTHMI